MSGRKNFVGALHDGGAGNRCLGRILRKSREDYRAIRSDGFGGIDTLAVKM